MNAIQVRRNGDSCIIRWTYEGQRYSLSWGRWNDQLEKARLSICAQIVYRDCLAGMLDKSLNKYRLWLSGIVPNGNGNGHSDSTRSQKKLPNLIQLIENRLQENYNAADDGLLRNLRNYKRKIDTPTDALEFWKWLSSKNLKDTTRKRYLAILQVVRRDLFNNIEVKVAEKPAPRPFTKNEVDRILTHLQNDPHYSHYYRIICFLFNTGCRPSEAIGLLWRDVDLTNRRLHIYESLARGDNGSTSKRKRKSTKTRKYRIVPINNKVMEVLTSVPRGADSDLVFPSPTGKSIDDHNLSQRCWRKTLEALGIQHRPLYTCRSTFVSHCVASGLTPQEISVITGHDVSVLYEHYLGSIRKPTLPEL